MVSGKESRKNENTEFVDPTSLTQHIATGGRRKPTSPSRHAIDTASWREGLRTHHLVVSAAVKRLTEVERLRVLLRDARVFFSFKKI